MSFKDIVNYKQEPIIMVEDEKKAAIIRNPTYRPILNVLRKGKKTAEEILEDIKKDEIHKNSSKKPPSIKTIYRHLKILTEAGFIAQAGVRNFEKKEKLPSSMKLFTRAAKFFIITAGEDRRSSKERIKNRTKLFTRLLSLDLNMPNLEEECIERIVNEIWKEFSVESQKKNKLFEEFPDETAEIFEKVPFGELRGLLEDYEIFKIATSPSDFSRKIKDCLKK